GSIRWKLYLLRERSILGLLAYFSLVRSLWASMLDISGPLYLAKRMMAYCGWLKDGPPLWQFNRIGDWHSTNSFLLDGSASVTKVVMDKMELLTKYTKAISYGIIEKSTKGWPECNSKSTW